MMKWTDRKRVLIAEDDGLVRDTLRTRLSVAGYEVHVARTGAEALQRILTVRPDVLVLDINMPELDGFGLLEALKNDHPDVKLPVMVLSARRNEADVRRAIELGARDYVLKGQLGGRAAGPAAETAEGEVRPKNRGGRKAGDRPPRQVVALGE